METARQVRSVSQAGRRDETACKDAAPLCRIEIVPAGRAPEHTSGMVRSMKAGLASGNLIREGAKVRLDEKPVLPAGPVSCGGARETATQCDALL